MILFILTVTIHGLGSYAIFLWAISWWKKKPALTVTHVWRTLVGLVAVLLVLHSLEVSLWAEFYCLRHCFADRETAYYFSLTSYTTLGFGDVVLHRPWRILAGLEAMIGVLMFGWSTASLAAFLHHVHSEQMRKHFSEPPPGL
jgi:voltage-gated potassium channel